MGSFEKLFGKTCGLQLPCERLQTENSRAADPSVTSTEPEFAIWTSSSRNSMLLLSRTQRICNQSRPQPTIHRPGD